jgi:hypothetical protein
MDVGAAHREHEVVHRMQQEVDALLLAHHADIADQVAPPVLEPLVRRADAHALEARSAAHHEHALGRHAAALDGDAPVGLVGGDGHIGAAECPALQPEHQAVEEIPPAELGFVQLRVDVVVVEDELLAEQLEEPADQEEEVRRIAGMNHVEAARGEHPPAQRERLPARPPSTPARSPERRALERQVIAPDRDALQELELLLVPLARGADDRHGVARVAQRGGLLPHAAVEGTGQVLHQHQDASRRRHHQHSPS